MVKRSIFLIIGFMALSFAAIGLVMPIMPTVPFLLVALWAFTRSSKRLQNWLLSHPTYGPTLKAWQQHSAVPKRVKIIAPACMLMGLPFFHYAADDLRLTTLWLLGLILISLYIYTRPNAENFTP